MHINIRRSKLTHDSDSKVCACFSHFIANNNGVFSGVLFSTTSHVKRGHTQIVSIDTQSVGKVRKFEKKLSQREIQELCNLYNRKKFDAHSQ